ncbi:MAG: DegQ family serine endoprotease [Pontibacterium sp.]
MNKRRFYSIYAFLALVFSVQAFAAQLPDFKTLVKQVSPAVVNISTIQKVERAAYQRHPFNDPNQQIPEIFRHFFQMPEQGQPRRQYPDAKPTPQSLGSGFIISSDGYIMTNHHVIDGADEVIVRLSDRRELPAEIIGSDKESDIAVLKIEAKGLPTAKLGDSDALEVGEWVLAIGSPFGFDHSVTSGIVSAKGRSLGGDRYVPFIQTDVAINPGNSGGPLFNLAGEVVGVNSQIYTRSGGFMGLSFAIPTRVALNVADQLKDKGRVERGWLGVEIQEVTNELAASFGLDKPEGALVSNVFADSPALEGGLASGDIILRFDGEAVERSSDLPPLVGRVKPGTRAAVVVLRDGRKENLTIRIGVLPSNDEIAQSRIAKPDTSGDNALAIVVKPLDEELRKQWRIYGGVVVSEVQEGAGARAGLVIGDVITSINGMTVDSLESFEDVVSRLPEGRPVPLRIVRRGNPMFLPLRVD